MPENGQTGVQPDEAAMAETKRYLTDYRQAPPEFPTQMHPPDFWEALGRAVATFGFLEETLGKAIFAFTGTRQIPEEEAKVEVDRWLPTLQKALHDPLGALIEGYGNAVRSNDGTTITNLDELLEDLRAASNVRNALCHGSWNSKPDADGRTVPFYINRKNVKFGTPFNAADLQQLQRQVVKLICDVVNSVTHMGWQFPGSSGPGKVLWRTKQEASE
jgi:hypothetical protein